MNSNMYQLNLLAGDGQEITTVKHRDPVNGQLFITVSAAEFVLNVDPREYFPTPLWTAGGVIAFNGGKGTRLLLTVVS